MCFAPPARVVEIGPGRAVVARGAARFTVATFLLEEPLAPGDWVAVQAQRHAIEKLTPEAAAEMLRLYAEIDTLLRQETATP